MSLIINHKFAVKTIVLLVFATLFFIGSINYIVDPYGKNNIFIFTGNVIKLVRDERSRKFELITKNPKASSFIFGSSRALVMDAKKLGEITKTEALNLAFSNATAHEYYMFIKYLLENRKVSNINIGIDLFAYKDNFISNGVMPPELLDYFGMKNNYSLKGYLSSKMFAYSLETLFINYIKQAKPNHFYTTSGKIIKKRYLIAIKNESTLKKHINEYVINDLTHWNSKKSELSSKQLGYLSQIKSMCDKYNVKLKLFMSPLYIKQITMKGNQFIEQKNLLRYIVNNISPVFDYNRITFLNINPYSFSDSFHYSYDVADMIIDDMYLKKSGDNMNYISRENIDSYIKTINQRLLN